MSIYNIIFTFHTRKPNGIKVVISNVDRGHHEEQFCVIALSLDQWFRRRCRLKAFYLEPWRPLCSVEQNHLCNVLECAMRNNSVNLISIQTSGSGRDMAKIYFLFRVLVAPFVQLW